MKVCTDSTVEPVWYTAVGSYPNIHAVRGPAYQDVDENRCPVYSREHPVVLPLWMRWAVK